MLRILRSCRFALASFLLAAAGASHAQQGPFVPLPFDYYETAGRVRVQQPINHLLGPGGKRLFEDSGLATDGGPGVQASGSGQIKNPSGNTASIGASGRVSGSAAAGAIGRAVTKIITPISIGVAIYDLAKELDFDFDLKPDGTVDLVRNDPTICSVGPCYEYKYSVAGGDGQFSSSKEAACQSAAAVNAASSYYLIAINPRVSGDNCFVDFIKRSDGSPQGGNNYPINSTRMVEPSSAVTVPSSRQEFEDAIAAKSGWPSTSAISRALADSVALTGEKLNTGPVTVTGPSSSPGTTTTTNNTTNNTTTTSTTNHQHTYEGDTINTTTTTTNVTVNNTTGETTNNETTTTQMQPPAEPVETCGLPGKPACKIDETGTPDAVTDEEYRTKLDTIKTDQDLLLNKSGGEADKTMFSSWQSFFVTPPLATCTVYTLPRDMGTIDPCPVVDGVRSFMAFLWAVTALWSGIRMIREVV